MKSDSIKLIDEVKVKFHEYMDHIYDFHFQFDEIFNAINMGKAGILSPQIIDHVLFIENYMLRIID